MCNAANFADQAYAAGNLDERSYVDLHASLLAKEIETLKQRRELLNAKLAGELNKLSETQA